MKTRRCSLGLVFFLAIAPAALARAQNGPSEAEVKEAIRKGVEFLKQAQLPSGQWSYAFNADHTLGMTALAGLALMENGTARDDPAIQKASEIVHQMSIRSSQTYDVSLAILFLARESSGSRGGNDDLIYRLADRLSLGGQEGLWSYKLPLENEQTYQLRRRHYAPYRRRKLSGSQLKTGEGQAGAGRDLGENPSDDQLPPPVRIARRLGGPGDNSNTQFALLGLWAASRHGFDADPPLRAIDEHFRSLQKPDGSWGYSLFGDDGSEAMTCAGLIGISIAAARPELADKKTALTRGAELAADPVFRKALAMAAREARTIDAGSDIYYLWSLERVCVALGMRKLEGLDWYAAASSELLRRQMPNGSWPDGRWGKLPDTCLALLVLRKANLAFELDRVLKLPDGSKPKPRLDDVPPVEDVPQSKPSGEVEVVIRQTDEAKFPDIRIDFEVRDADGKPIAGAKESDFKVEEYDQPATILKFAGPGRSVESKPATVVLVVDHSKSMEDNNKINALRQSVAVFLKLLPQGSRVAVVGFSTEVQKVQEFTDDFAKIQKAVDALEPDGETRCYDAVAEALKMLEPIEGRRVVLCLTDGEDTSSTIPLDDLISLARRAKGAPVFTIGLGDASEIDSDSLSRLAKQTRGQYYPARQAKELSMAFEEFAVAQGRLYQIVYKTNREIPDGTLRPVSVFYKEAKRGAHASIYIRGMVVPARGWSRLFLGLLAGLGLLAILPALARRLYS